MSHEKTLDQIQEGKYLVPHNELTPWKDNYFIYKREDINKLKIALEDEGQLDPIIADAGRRMDRFVPAGELGAQGTIVAGNKTWVAVGELIEEGKWLDRNGQPTNLVWVEPKVFKNDAHAIKVALLDNAHYGVVDKEKAYALSEILMENDIDINAIPIDFSNDDVRTLLDLRDYLGPSSQETPTDIKEDNFEVVLPDQPKTKLGDVYQLGNHRLMCGDSTIMDEVEKLMDGQKADMVFTDPPYGVDYSSRVDKDRRKPWGGIKNDDLKGESLREFLYDSLAWLDVPKYVCCNWQSVTDFFLALGKPNALIVWDKGSIGLGAGFRNQHEFILFYGKLAHNSESNVWTITRDSTSGYAHPTQKPIAVPSRAIKNLSGENVLDLFGGSGSTLIACEQLDRVCYMMELDPKYCDVIVDRWEKFTGKKAQLL